jgi:hypothetical protein
MNGKEPSPGLDLGNLPGVLLDSDAAAISATDLMDLVKDEFQQQGEVPPCADKILVLSRVIAGYLRTCPLPECASLQGQSLAITSFVGACPPWWTRHSRDYGKLAALLDDVFHQREVGVPSAAAMEMLNGVTAGIMRSKRLPRTEAAQLAMADWIATLYLAGLEDW